MNRTTIALGSILAAGLLLAACGGDDDPSTTAMPGSQEDAPATDDMSGMDDEEMSGMDDQEVEGDSPTAQGARSVEVDAGDFTFDPAEMTAAVGEDLAIVLTSQDISHDFTIDELDVRVTADAGQTEEGGISDLEAGTYTYYCSVPGHREAGMEGTLTVA